MQGHAYAIIDVKAIRQADPPITARLVLMRNPHGHRSEFPDDGEWNGAWSDKWKGWDQVTKETKDILKYDVVAGTNDGKGAFWITFDDMVHHFAALYTCRIPRLDTKEDSDGNTVPFWQFCPTLEQETRQETNHGASEWKDDAAGGSPNFSSWIYNPQWELVIKAKKHLIIKLSQADPRYAIKFEKLPNGGFMPRKEASTDIAVTVYKITEDRQPLCVRQGDKIHTMSYHKVYNNERTVCIDEDFDPGIYIVVCSTFKSHVEKPFRLCMWWDGDEKLEPRRITGHLPSDWADKRGKHTVQGQWDSLVSKGYEDEKTIGDSPTWQFVLQGDSHMLIEFEQPFQPGKTHQAPKYEDKLIHTMICVYKKEGRVIPSDRGTEGKFGQENPPPATKFTNLQSLRWSMFHMPAGSYIVCIPTYYPDRCDPKVNFNLKFYCNEAFEKPQRLDTAERL